MKLLPFLGCLALAGCVAPQSGPTLQEQRDAKILELRAQGKVRGRFVDEIQAGKAAIGMNPYEAFLAWGPPDDVNTRVSRHGRSEQCVYGGFRNGRYRKASYLYFDNGVLTSISN
jgi:hypothetical protein